MLIAPVRYFKPVEPYLLRFGNEKQANDSKNQVQGTVRKKYSKPRLPYLQNTIPQILNGREVPLPTTEYITNTSPDRSSPNTAIPLRAVQTFGNNDLNLIAQAAQVGYEKFSKTTFAQRAIILDKLANLLEAHKPQLARLIALEVAKPIDRAEAEVSRSIQLARNYAAKARESEVKAKERRDMGNGHGIYQTLRPLGPVLAYTPFNFPLNLVMHKLAPAIGAGTSIVIKPSPRCPITSLYLAKLCTDAGYKAISVVNLNNSQAKELVQNPTFKVFSFTGAPQVGFMLKDHSKAEKNVLELGNNSPLIIEDVKNKAQLKEIAERAALFKFSFAGQTCIAVQRILINEPLYSDFLKYFESALENIKMGNVLDDKTVLGPMIDKQAAERAQQWVCEALAQGARILGPDQAPNRIVQPGWFKPTALINTTSEMDVNRKEVFAPIVTITPYKTFKEGITLANNSDFALHTGLYTQSRKKIAYARNHLDATGLNINEVPTYRDDRLAYGGTRLSGIGAEGSDVGIEDYSRIIYTDINETFGQKQPV